MKVIQLRGTNATGKTTAIRQFIEHGEFEVRQFKTGKTIVEYHWEEKRKIAVLGRYDQRVSGGIDGRITNRNVLIDIIIIFLKDIKPKFLLFEGIVYGVTFQFGYDVQRIAKKYGYQYIGVCLIPPLESVFERLAERNGNKPVDYMSVQEKWFTASKAYEKLRENGIKVKAIDTSKISKENMYRIVEDEI